MCNDEEFEILNDKIAGWLIAHSILGLLATSLIIVAAIPDNREVTCEVESQIRMKNTLVTPIGLTELVHFIWFLVGTSW